MKIFEKLSNTFSKKKKSEKREAYIPSDSILSKMLSQNTDIVFSGQGGYEILEIPALMACMNKISSSVGQLPLDVYLRTKNGKEPDRESELSYILKNRPNENMTPSLWKKYIVNQLFIFGECFAKVIRNTEGEIRAIEPVKKGTYNFILKNNSKGLEGAYFANERVLKPQDKVNLLRFRENLNNDGNSMSPLTRLTETIGMDKGTTKFLQEYLNNMVSPSFILEIDSDLSMDKANAIGDAFRKGIVGSHGAPLVIQKGLSAKEFNLTLPIAKARGFSSD